MRTTTGLLVLALLSPTAFADVKLTYDDGGGAAQYTLFIKGSQLRMETHDDEHAVVLFDADKREMIVLETARREYMKFDQATLARLQEQMKQALAMAEKFGMSPEQLGIDVEDEVPVTVSTGEKKTVNGYDCIVERYEVGKFIDSIACIASPDEVGLSSGDWQTMQRMFGMLTEMTNDMMPGDLGGFDLAAPNGIAVEASDEDGDERQVLSDVDHGTIDGAKFAIPSGYKRIEMPSFDG